MVTVPYRALALVIAIMVLLLNYKVKGVQKVLALNIFWVFWMFFIARVYYDVNLRSDVLLSDVSQLWLYIFCICLLPMYAIQKSFYFINTDLALSWIIGGVSLILVTALFNIDSQILNPGEVADRVGASIAVNTITFGHIGAMGVILSLFMLQRKKGGYKKKIFYLFIIALSVFTLLKAGSRSPIVALLIVLLFWVFARGKYVIQSIIITLLLILFIVVFSDKILHLMGKISPIIELRMRATVDGGDTSGRELLFYEAFDSFAESPLLGSQFALIRTNGFVNSHNIIMDALMGLGVLGGCALLYVLLKSIKVSYLNTHFKNPTSWISLILIQQIVICVTSGALYYEQLINVLLVFTFTYIASFQHQRKMVSPR
ncbi:O-antigen ligase family protein [Kaistella montana]|uniref:O-antigen ligase family protein n=1 Tax=Kaistella montana TaxID=1849733 RepID=A0ABW5K851_9FLAO|nr:O-antigen ligase family protein [Kaistella montana]MCQ4035402.1 O-antigen ligase family protein [Kaistella montana]